MPASTIEGAGVPLAVAEQGEGRPVLLIHDIGRPAPAAGFPGRVITYARRGYGASGAPEPYEATTVHEQAEDAVAVLDATAAAPAVVVGFGFGALVALDVAGRHTAAVAGLVLLDPPLYAFVAEAAKPLAAQRSQLEEALREGGPEAAFEGWLGGPSPWEQPAHRAFFADLAGITSWPVTRGTLRAIAAPAVVVTSPDVPPHLLAAADALAALLPGARRTHDGDAIAAAASLDP